MSIWPGVCDTFQYFILEHVCVFSLCIWVVTCLTTQFEGKQYMLVVLHFVCLCGKKWGCVQKIKKINKKGRGKGNEIQCWMNYGVCIVTYCVLFRVCEWMEFMCERCRNKNEKLQCVLDIVSGTVWIACGCLAGLIPLKSTISLHSLSTKNMSPS